MVQVGLMTLPPDHGEVIFVIQKMVLEKRRTSSPQWKEDLQEQEKEPPGQDSWVQNALGDFNLLRGRKNTMHSDSSDTFHSNWRNGNAHA